MKTQDNNNGIKFTSVDIKNFKGIHAKSIDIAGKSLVVIGNNGKDKSSFLQVLKSSVDASFMPDKPLQEGAERGSFCVKIAGELEGKHREYTIEYFFTPSNGKGKIVVKDSNGEAVKSPKNTIESLVGDISFDVFKFIAMPKGKQIDVLKRLSGKGNEIDLIQIKKKEVLDLKSKKVTEMEFFEKTVSEHKFSEEELELYSVEKDDKGLQSDLVNISTKLTAYNKVKDGVTARQKQNEKIETVDEVSIEEDIKEYRKQIIAFEEKIEKKYEELDSLNTTSLQNIIDIKAGQEWLIKNPEPNVITITEAIQEIRLHNEYHEKIEELKEKHVKVINMKSEITKLQIDAKDLDTKRDQLIKNSELPVQGLTFTEDEVLYNGLPFSDLQLNKAKIIEIGMMVGMALNPKLRCVFIQDGSLLDQESLNTIVTLAESKGYQVMIEMVKFEKDSEMEILYVEDFLK